MKTIAIRYLLYVVLITFSSWLGWWFSVDSQFALIHNMGDLLSLWRKFNEAFMLGSGLGFAALIIVSMVDKKDEKSK